MLETVAIAHVLASCPFALQCTHCLSRDTDRHHWRIMDLNRAMLHLVSAAAVTPRISRPGQGCLPFVLAYPHSVRSTCCYELDLPAERDDDGLTESVAHSPAPARVGHDH